MKNQLRRDIRLLRGPRTALIVLAIALGGCASDGDDENSRASAPTVDQTTAAPGPAGEPGRQAPRKEENGDTKQPAKLRKAPSTAGQLQGFTQVELRRAARRVMRRLEPRPEAVAQRRAVEQLIARAQPIKRRLERNPRKHQGEDQRELQRRAKDLLERLR